MALSLIKNFDDLAANMADPPVNRPIANAIAQFGRSVCDRISARPDLYAPTILQSPLVAACTPYWNAQGYDEPVTEPPFAGGQCDTVAYDVTLQETLSPGGTSNSPRLRANGPINVRARPTSFSPEGQVTGYTIEIFARRWWVLGGSSPPLGEPRWIFFSQRTVDTGTNLSVTFINVVRVDGQADNCGDPPPETSPGDNPAPDPGPLPPGTGPQIDIRGNPVLVLPPTLEISPNITVELPIGEINLGSGSNSDAAIAPLADDEVPGGGSGAGGGENDFGEAPPGERWVGCCVRITATPVGAGRIPQAEPESIYPRTIGNVRLRFSGLDGLSAYDTPIVNRQRTTCVWEPVRGLQPTGVRVNLLPGFEYVFTPYSVPLEN